MAKELEPISRYDLQALREARLPEVAEDSITYRQERSVHPDGTRTETREKVQTRKYK